ncbi:hypothetical protein PGTUg99_021559 [Puccinia graminis f. sp. tritici]|uniref:C2H2-type domain-containing protein n=1 Tax=Puccinia graminis f. sp. tritici TaxID=56615 RepID=A0A5B0MH64_PUCGR|nr:hypothetical protein PGTUg99_021559 [Puccinia graminis f. sp. tritici]
MKLHAASLRINLAVLITLTQAQQTMAQGHRLPECPNNYCTGDGKELTPQEISQLSLKSPDKCGWESKRTPVTKCLNERDKSYYRCCTCNKIFSTNTAHENYSNQPCSHRFKAFVPGPSCSNPGPSEPEVPSTRPPTLHQFFPN